MSREPRTNGRKMSDQQSWHWNIQVQCRIFKGLRLLGETVGLEVYRIFKRDNGSIK